jgi:GH24 family phage-related lysozyme (muramidase)
MSMLTAEFRAKLKALVIKHEGRKNYPYTDTVGKVTIGIGYNLTDRGMPDKWIDEEYDRDASYFYHNLYDDFPFFKDLSPNRQIALIDMSFMGYKKIKGFKKMWAALSIGDYDKTAEEMLDSKWAKQEPNRANELAFIVKTDEL